MQSLKVVLMIFFIQIAFLSCKKGSMTIEDDTEFITVAGFTYGKYDGEWYNVSDGKKGDQVILARLITKPKSGIDMNNFNYQDAGVPTLSVVDVIVGEFYVLDTSELSDPFEIARKLWNTGEFEHLYFDTYGLRTQ